MKINSQLHEITAADIDPPLFWGIDRIIYATPLADLIAFLWPLFFIKREFEEMTQRKNKVN